MNMVGRTFVKIMRLLFAAVPLLLFSTTAFALEPEIHSDPRNYVIEKLESNDIVFLGMTHRKPRLLEFAASLIPHLQKVGVTHVGLEIPSDQQHTIDRVLDTGDSLDQILLHTQIECAAYRSLLRVIRGFGKERRPEVVALDIPTNSLHSNSMNRDEWMAHSIEKLFVKPGVKVFVVVGNLHVIKDIQWEDKVLNPNGFISSYLLKLNPQLRLFSIGQCVDERPSQCDFTKAFGQTENAVAVDCEERFFAWKTGILSSVAAIPTGVCDMFDGIIIY